MTVNPRELAAVMVERARRDLAARAATAETVRDAVLAALRRALDEGRGRRAWLIGSLASGDFAEGSDVDVVMEGLALNDEGAVRDALERASGREVDLLRLEELMPGFRTAVLEEGVPVR